MEYQLNLHCPTCGRQGAGLVQDATEIPAAGADPTPAEVVVITHMRNGHEQGKHDPLVLDGREPL
jgi:hypothetical protein